MEKKTFTIGRRRIWNKSRFAVLTFISFSMAFTSCSDAGLEEMLDNNQKTDFSQQSQQDEWAIRSVYFLSKMDTVLIEACMTMKDGEEKWEYSSEVNESQKQEMLDIADNLSYADVDSCTDSPFVIHNFGQYLKTGRCQSVPECSPPYKVVGVWIR